MSPAPIASLRVATPRTPPGQMNLMRKLALTLFTTILIVFGAGLTIKAFLSATTSTAARQTNLPAQRAQTMVIVPTMDIMVAPIIDRNASIFVGTGDASAGSWSAP